MHSSTSFSLGFSGTCLMLNISSVNYSSHLSEETFKRMKELMDRYRDVILSADLSLYYLEEADASFTYPEVQRVEAVE